MRRGVAALRDVAIGLAGVCAFAIHGRAQNWWIGVVALIVAAGWIGWTRSGWRSIDAVRPFFATVLVVVSVLRLTEGWIAVAVAGSWATISALDLDRLYVTFPVDSPPLDQRLVLQRRLLHLGVLAIVSAGVVLLARSFTLPLRMPALLLMVVFVFVVIQQLVKRIVVSGRPEQQ